MHQGEHGRVVVHHRTQNGADAAPSGISDDRLHQHRAQAAPVPVAAHHDSELGGQIVGVGVQAHDAKRHAIRYAGGGHAGGGHAGGAVGKADERHLPVVVDLRQAGE